MIEVEVENRSGAAVDGDGAAELVRRVLEAEGIDDGEVAIAFVGPEESRALKREHLGVDEATDVLSFPLDGREDDLVKVEGKRVALGEVEGCLEAYPKVRAAQARVFLDDQGAAMVVASVVCSTRCMAEEIIDHCAKNLAPYKVPRRIEFCSSLPA